MGSSTVSRVPDDVIARIKKRAVAAGRSMEEELRLTLSRQYAARAALIEEIRAGWQDVGSLGPDVKSVDPDELRALRDEGRP